MAECNRGERKLYIHMCLLLQSAFKVLSIKYKKNRFSYPFIWNLEFVDIFQNLFLATMNNIKLNSAIYQTCPFWFQSNDSIIIWSTRKNYILKILQMWASCHDSNYFYFNTFQNDNTTYSQHHRRFGVVYRNISLPI